MSPTEFEAGLVDGRLVIRPSTSRRAAINARSPTPFARIGELWLRCTLLAIASIALVAAASLNGDSLAAAEPSAREAAASGSRASPALDPPRGDRPRARGLDVPAGFCERAKIGDASSTSPRAPQPERSVRDAEEPMPPPPPSPPIPARLLERHTLSLLGERYDEEVTPTARRLWYSSGEPFAEIGLADGVRDGLSRCWWRNGLLREESRWRRGVRDGVARTWHENGQLASEQAWPAPAKCWREDGSPIAE